MDERLLKLIVFDGEAVVVAYLGFEGVHVEVFERLSRVGSEVGLGFVCVNDEVGNVQEGGLGQEEEEFGSRKLLGKGF